MEKAAAGITCVSQAATIAANQYQVHTPLPTLALIPTRTPIPTPIVLDNGGYLYVDKEAGYSFSYPPNAYFHTSKEGDLGKADGAVMSVQPLVNGRLLCPYDAPRHLV